MVGTGSGIPEEGEEVVKRLDLMQEKVEEGRGKGKGRYLAT